MKSTSGYERMTLAEQLHEGLRQAVAHARGKLTLRTTVLVGPPPKLTSKRVVAIRRKTGMSQAVFASYLNVPTRTLQSWEQGARLPKASEARLLQIAEAAPQRFRKLIGEAASARPAVRRLPANRRRAAA